MNILYKANLPVFSGIIMKLTYTNMSVSQPITYTFALYIISHRYFSSAINAVNLQKKYIDIMFLNTEWFHYIDRLKQKLNQVHVVFRTQQSRQREPNVKAHRSTLSAEIWGHCVLSDET